MHNSLFFVAPLLDMVLTMRISLYVYLWLYCKLYYVYLVVRNSINSVYNEAHNLSLGFHLFSIKSTIFGTERDKKPVRFLVYFGLEFKNIKGKLWSTK